MKTVCGATRLAVLLSVLLIGGGIAATLAADPKGGQQAPPMGMNQDEMKQMMALAQPGEHHKAMDRLVGDWKTSVKMYMGSADPTTSIGSASYQWILGGRYMQEKHTGNIGGMPFEGLGITGYDNAKDEYFNVWFDNMGTGVMHLTGHRSDDGDGITFMGTTFDPMLKKDTTVREEIRWQDDRHFTFTMYMPVLGPGGESKESKVMEMAAEKQ